MPAATQTADRSKVVSVPPAGTPIADARMRLTDDDYGAYALTFTNGGPRRGHARGVPGQRGWRRDWIEWDGTELGASSRAVQIVGGSGRERASRSTTARGGLTAVQFNGTSFVIPSSAVNPTWMQSPAASGAGGRWIFADAGRRRRLARTPAAISSSTAAALIAGNAGGLKVENGAFETWSLWCDNSYARISGGGKGSRPSEVGTSRATRRSSR
jgi:hypothetical protein